MDRPSSKYSDEQIRAALATARSNFHDFMERMLTENSHDVRFFFYVDNLLVNIYEHYLNGKYITKTQACRLIPIGHSNTCKKYVDEAVERGFIKLESDKVDGRRVLVVPTGELISYVRAKMESAIDEARHLIGRVSEVKSLPRDNKPLADYPKKLLV